MGNKINDTTNYPAVTPAATDRVLGIDVSNTTNDANGGVVTFTVQSIADTVTYTVTESDVTNHEAALTITESQISDLGSYIADVVSDTTPQLGGSLDVNGNKIVSTSNGNIDIEPHGTGDVLLGNFTFDADQTVGAGQDSYVLTYNNSSGKISLEEAGGGGGGRETWISTTTISDDAAVDISLAGSYDHYLIVLTNVRPASSGSFWIRTGDGGGIDSGASDYSYVYNLGLSGSGAMNYVNDHEATEIRTTTTVGHESVERLGGEIRVYPSDGTRWTAIVGRLDMVSDALSKAAWSHFAGARETTTAITDVRFFMASGNLSDGEIHLYGVTEGA